MLPSSGNVLDFRREREKMHVDMVVEVVEVMKGELFLSFLSPVRKISEFSSVKRKKTLRKKNEAIPLGHCPL